jgi:hypothetical protein
MPNRTIWSIAAALAGAGLACCGSTDAPAKSPTRIVSADAFADPGVVRAAPEPAEFPPADRLATGAGTDVVAIAGDAPAPSVVAAPTSAIGDRLVVDQMVGQINGKPIYAEEFFRDMDARLRELSTRMPLRQWIKDVRTDIEASLWDQTRDELLLAEFRSTLTPEMRVGVLAFVEDIQSRITAGAGGSEEQANERALEEEGLTLREKVKTESERSFVLQQLRRSIANRVYVSSRDIEQYYDQNHDKFNPPPIAVFTVIRIPADDSGAIARVESRLAAGDAFVDVAAAESGWAVDKANQHRVIIEAPSFQEQEFWAIEELNTPTRQLSPGQATGRITARGAAWWIALTEIERPAGKSLYDVQLEIEKALRAERLRAEEIRYFQRLLAKSNMSDMQDMTTRLVEYAAVRYYVRPDTAATGG